MENKFEQFLKNKYGKEITGRLVKQNRLNIEDIRQKNHADQELVKKHLQEVKNILGLDLEIDNHRWAFDFPGWIGQLDFSENTVRKFMVVGLEPHAEEFDFQITYGLSDMTPINNEPRFSLDTNKSDFIRCKNDSSSIWTNLFKLPANEAEKKSVLEEKNEQTLKDFLHQFYITDLCHFAPQDQANAIHKVSNWSKNRFKVADYFLKTEIEIIKPEIIITQGTGVFGNIVKCLNIKEIEDHKFSVGKQMWSIKAGRYNNSKIISVPHIGSQMTHKTFWMKNLEAVREILDLEELVS